MTMLRACALLAFLFQAGAATAKPKAAVSSAQKLADGAEVLLVHREFIDAAKLFERAQAEEPRLALLYKIADAYDQAHDLKDALEAYQRALDGVPKSAEAPHASERLAAIQAELTRLDALKATTPVRPSEPFVEPLSKHSFATRTRIGEVDQVLVGAGTRKILGVKVYAMGMYVEEEAARRRMPDLVAEAGGSDRDTLVRGEHAAQFIVHGKFDKLAVLHFVHKVSAKETADAYRPLLAEDLSDKNPQLKQDTEAFLALFADVSDGDDVLIHTSAEGFIWVESHGKKRNGPRNQRLSYDVWNIWLGAKPISADLKHALFGRIDLLAK